MGWSRRRVGPWGALLVLCVAAPAWADPPGGRVDDAEVETVTMPRLLEQVALRYPDEALADGLHGDVTVRVSLDAEGRVTDVEVVSGPEVFHAEAIDAGHRLRFAPATRAGESVPSTAKVFFHFAPPEPVEVPDAPVAEIVVHAPDEARRDTHARTTLDAEALEEEAGGDLATAASRVAGVEAAQGTTGASKPIIRGQSERRLLLRFDGVRHESQKWGPDHAPEIDPFSAGSVSVIKGAAGVRYGPDAVGGVLLVDPPPMRAEPGVGGRALLSFASNGLRPYGAVRIDGAPAKVSGLSLRAEGSYTRGAALEAPDYVLGNTGSEVWNVGGAVQYQWDATQLRATYHHHDFRSGVFFGVTSATPDDFLAQLEAEAPPGADAWRRSYTIERPYQEATHDVVALHGRTRIGDAGTLTGTYAFQLNQRREYETVRSATGPQFDFTLRTHSLDLAFEHDPVAVGRAALAGTVGVQAGFEENVFRGLPLIPNFRGFTVGVFATERFTFERADLELGARYDHLTRTAFLGEQDYARHVRRGTLGDGRCSVRDTEVARCPEAYHTGSVSLGTLVHLMPEALDLKLDLSSASRFPDVDELYLVGSAPSLPVYAVGAPDLGVETTWGGSPTLGLRLPWLEAELSAHASFVDQFVYFAPERTEAGEIAFDVTIRGAYPRWSYRPVDAVFYGTDLYASFGPDWWVGLDVRGSVVRAQDVSTGDHLVGIPPDRLSLALTGRPPGFRELVDPFLTVSTDLVNRQFLVDPAQDVAPAPPGYALLGLAAGGEVVLRRTTMRFAVEIRNVLDTSYRRYTSLLRYYADQPGRDVRVRLAIDF